MIEKKIVLADCRRWKYCIPGSRLFAKKYGLDFKDFARNGISVEKLLATGDAMAKRIVKWKFGEVDK
ncbi:MAG: hypothetical protein ACU843_12625 [Gammaproteobacteria bacterium]